MRRMRPPQFYAALTAATLLAMDGLTFGQGPAVALYDNTIGREGRYTFEIWEEKLVGGLGSHSLIVMKDTVQDKAIVLQGLATNRDTGVVRPAGVPWEDNILAYYAVRPVTDLTKYNSKGTLLKTDDPKEAMIRLAAMLKAGELINEHQYPYDVTSAVIAYNSNAMATTMADAAGFDIGKTQMTGFAPGLGHVISVMAEKHLPPLSAIHGKAMQADINTLKETVKRLASDMAISRMPTNANEDVELAYTVNDPLSGDEDRLDRFLQGMTTSATKAQPTYAVRTTSVKVNPLKGGPSPN